MRYSVTGTTEAGHKDWEIFYYVISRLEGVSEFTTGGASGADYYSAIYAYNSLPDDTLLRGCFPLDKYHNKDCHAWVDDVEMVPGTYMDRNLRLVYHADILLAFPKTGKEERRSGTWATVRRARNPRKFGLDKDPIPVYVFPLNGEEPYIIN